MRNINELREEIKDLIFTNIETDYWSNKVIPGPRTKERFLEVMRWESFGIVRLHDGDNKTKRYGFSYSGQLKGFVLTKDEADLLKSEVEVTDIDTAKSDDDNYVELHNFDEDSFVEWLFKSEE